MTDDQFRNLLLFSMATFVILFITGWIMTKIWRRRLKRDEVPKDVTSAELKTSVDALRKIEQAIRRGCPRSTYYYRLSSRGVAAASLKLASLGGATSDSPHIPGVHAAASLKGIKIGCVDFLQWASCASI